MLTVRLLGRPALERDGRPVSPPRGMKTWALLAFLLLADRAPSRQRLVSLLFTDADDPLGALRWSLSQLRRALGDAATIDGDPVQLRLHAGHQVDVHALLSGRRFGDDQLVRLGGELLEGIEIDAGAAFEAWLAVQRQRLAASCQALLYDAALDALAQDKPERAAELAARVVELDPFNAEHHVVLVRSLAELGDGSGAWLQVARCADLFRRELGQEAPPSVAQAARITDPRARLSGVTISSATARSYFDAGQASLLGGAVDVGLEQLQRAVDMARSAGDGPLTAVGLVTLAGGKMHGAGRRGAEVAGPLHEALAIARASGDDTTAGAACRELAFLGVQLGHHDLVDAWLDEAEQLDLGDEEHARVLGVRGMSHSDAADYPGALDALERSVEHAERAGARRQAAWSRSMVGRIHVLRGEPAQAAVVLDQALETSYDTQWTMFLPWVESFRAEAAIDHGELEAAGALLEHAWVLATEARDHCWMTTAARGLVRLAAAGGDHAGAVRWIGAGMRPSAWYLWPCANLLDAGCAVAASTSPELAEQWADELIGLAARGGMREHVVRAQVHRGTLGDSSAFDAARHGALDIDNPALDRLLDHADVPS